MVVSVGEGGKGVFHTSALLHAGRPTVSDQISVNALFSPSLSTTEHKDDIRPTACFMTRRFRARVGYDNDDMRDGPAR